MHGFYFNTGFINCMHLYCYMYFKSNDLVIDFCIFNR